MSNVVNKLWDYCNILRHDGISYGDYIEQLTYLLFLKIANEKEIYIPAKCGWADLIQLSGTELLDSYNDALRMLSRQKGILGDIFARSISRFRQPVNLKRLITLIDETDWSSLDVDIKAEAYEGLLQKYASEQKGAGQYFTPRPAIRAIVKCINPDIKKIPNLTIHDPAIGTAGFLIAAYEWIMDQTNGGALLSRSQRKWIQKNAFSGGEIVLETRRLALMNLFLHEIEAKIYYEDSLSNGPHTSMRYDLVLTNPPFGIKGGGDYSAREDFTITTSNKQLNFLQHTMTILKDGGSAAIVLPDNVLFTESGKEIRKILLKDCDLHTLLRLPNGMFTPYSTGVKANVLFFRKGKKTEKVWVYNMRSNFEIINKGNPLIEEHFVDFTESYLSNPRIENDRFRLFSIQEIKDRDFNLDLAWLDNISDDSDNDKSPEELILEIISNLETSLDHFNELTFKSKKKPNNVEYENG